MIQVFLSAFLLIYIFIETKDWCYNVGVNNVVYNDLERGNSTTLWKNFDDI
mgnify:CR=1 FL=1|jgi:hypothetical protein